jgi:solute:Na+ symporter, SSS family
VFFVFGFISYGFTAMGIWLVCMVILKFTWYDRLKITAA